jgi:hypothetical protein
MLTMRASVVSGSILTLFILSVWLFVQFDSAFVSSLCVSLAIIVWAAWMEAAHSACRRVLGTQKQSLPFWCTYALMFGVPFAQNLSSPSWRPGVEALEFAAVLFFLGLIWLTAEAIVAVERRHGVKTARQTFDLLLALALLPVSIWTLRERVLRLSGA